MPTVTVTQGSKGKFKVLINYIQRGPEYSTKAIADHEASKIRETLSTTYRDR